MRGELEIKAAIKDARDWFYREYGEELSVTELAKYFSDKYEAEKVAALRNRFESYRGADLATACAVCVHLASTPCRPAKRK
jgi:hypothetical protein